MPGHTATMSSYAGAVFSLDDFVTLSSGLVTTETSLFIYNTSLYEDTQPREQVGRDDGLCVEMTSPV